MQDVAGKIRSMAAITTLIVVGFLPTLTQATIPTRTVTHQIQSGDDDYKETSTGLSQRGDTQQDLWVSADLFHAYRFVSFAVPPGATIVSAQLQLYATTNLTAAISGTAFGEAVGNAGGWTTGLLISTAPHTETSVAISGLPSWTNNAFNDVVDVAPVVQEIVNRADYEYGNAVKIFLTGSTSASRRTKTYNANPSFGAKLIVTYEWPGCPIPGPECPATLKFTPDYGPEALDTGWTGVGHDKPLFPFGAEISMRVRSCAGTDPCGVCEVSEPLPNDDGLFRRCSNNTSVHCDSDSACFRQCVGGINDGAPCTAPSQCPPGNNCQGAGTCRTYVGTYMPATLDALIPLCTTSLVTHTGADDIVGTINVDTGETDIGVPISTYIKDATCATCENDTMRNDGHRDGTCSGGVRNGKPCDSNGRSFPAFGDTSLDCPLAEGSLGQETRAIFPLTTDDPAALVLGTASPFCTAPGFSGVRCFCNTCNDEAQTPCSSNADCPAAGPVCGAKRCMGGENAGALCSNNSSCPGSSCNWPGQPTQPNQCTDDANIPGDGTGQCQDGRCLEAPADASVCGPSAGHISCLENEDCEAFFSCDGGLRDGESCDPMNAAADCAGSSCVSDVCLVRNRACFGEGTLGDTIDATGGVTAIGSYDWNVTIGAVGCAGAAAQPIASIIGLPGPSTFQIEGRLTGTVASNVLDVVVANFDTPNRICHGDGATNFTCSDVDATTYASNDVLVADLDADGDSDLVFANSSNANVRCLNDGSANFTCAAIDAAGYDSYGIAVGDFNEDQYLDLAFARSGVTSRVCEGDGSGGFSCADVGTFTGDTRDVVAGDFSQDNNLDLVFARSGGARNQICLGDGAGGFSCGDVSTDAFDARGVVAGDFNRDGKRDLVFANHERSPAIGTRNRVCLGNGSGAFTCNDVSNDAWRSRDVVAADLNGDSLVDLVFANSNQSSRKCLGDGAGGFTCGNSDYDVEYRTGVAIGDIDRSCTPDLVFSNSYPSGSQRPQQCLNNTLGQWICVDISSDADDSRAIAVGTF